MDDDPSLGWPSWKFGMKRDDILTTLQDQYNTLTFSLQDPEAFRNDVNEISRSVDTAEEFHRFMARRHQQRLAELQESLESLAVEIIANPKLIGSDQWQHALQLFRTHSLDSLVRYFGSYLPDHYLDRRSSSASSFSETDSIHTTASASTFLDDNFPPNGPAMTCEPLSIDTSATPMSPRSEATQSPADCRSLHLCTDCVQADDDETSQSDDCDTAVTSVCDSTETRSSYDPADDVDAKEPPVHILGEEDDDDEFPTAQHPEDDFCFPTFTPDNYETLQSDTPTPGQVPETTCHIEYKSVARKSPLPRSRLTRAERSPLQSPLQVIRRSPEEVLSKIQKADSIRKRAKGRRWLGLA